MNKLPPDIIIKIYEFNPEHREKFKPVLETIMIITRHWIEYKIVRSALIRNLYADSVFATKSLYKFMLERAHKLYVT